MTQYLPEKSWLLAEADALFRTFGKSNIDVRGGFFELDARAKPYRDGRPRQLHNTTRMAHCHAIGVVMGRAESADMLDHAMEFLWHKHRDQKNGGYFWGVAPDGSPSDPLKQAYGHGFVLLAASSAKMAGHPDADRLLSDIAAVIEDKFWEQDQGLSSEEYTADWQVFSDYRGQNSNMHLTEALMNAYEATGEVAFLDKARGIIERIIMTHAQQFNWRVPEHYHADWRVDKEHDGNPIFRPYGSTPGHGLEWARLILQFWALDGKRDARLPDAAVSLFSCAISDGWDKNGGIYYTVNWDGSPRISDRYWWPVCEAIGAAYYLEQVTGVLEYKEWQGRLWAFSDQFLIDRDYGGWHPQLAQNGKPASDPFYGKPDIYHALQACLIPVLPAGAGLMVGLTKS